LNNVPVKVYDLFSSSCLITHDLHDAVATHNHLGHKKNSPKSINQSIIYLTQTEAHRNRQSSTDRQKT